MYCTVHMYCTDLRPVHRGDQPVVHGHDDVALPGAAPEGRAVRPHALDDQMEAPLLAEKIELKCIYRNIFKITFTVWIYV